MYPVLVKVYTGADNLVSNTFFPPKQGDMVGVIYPLIEIGLMFCLIKLRENSPTVPICSTGLEHTISVRLWNFKDGGSKKQDFWPVKSSKVDEFKNGLKF